MSVLRAAVRQILEIEHDGAGDGIGDAAALALIVERGVIIKTGEQTYFLIGMWPSQEAMAAARPAMIKTLDSFRATLDDQGEGRGVTDAVSGAVVLDL